MQTWTQLTPAQRYSTKNLPRETYLPGLTSHPDPEPEVHEDVDIKPENWMDLKDYLYGVDLYNHGYWWESHEAWERLWQKIDKQSDMGQFLQGLIQISAAFIKRFLLQPEGLQRLYHLGVQRLESVSQTHRHYMGVDLLSHLEQIAVSFSPALINLERALNISESYPYITLIHKS